MANLKTNGVPTSDVQQQRAISIQDGLVFTGRCGRGYGMVFVHDIKKNI